MTKSTSNNILYGELGRFPSDILIKARMIGFLKRVFTGKQDLKCTRKICIIPNGYVLSKQILISCGFSHYWLSQYVPENCNLARMVKVRLIDQSWFGLIYDSPKYLNYRIFKISHGFESYLNYLPVDLRIALSKFRNVNHKLPIERGRFWGIAICKR